MNVLPPEVMQDDISTPKRVVKSPEISFVIPALNEERYIADTVRQFSRLEGKFPYEVIVADGGSTDKTVEIAIVHGAKAVIDSVERKTIASGRNLGAQGATGELLVFCDADTRFEDIETFTTRIRDLFQDQRIVAAVPRVEVFPAERNWHDRLFWGLVNRFFYVSFLLGCPYSGGQCQVVRQKKFVEVQGYDSAQVHGEDSTLMKRLCRVGQLRFMWDLAILESPRRYRQMGYLKLMAVGIYSSVAQSIFKRNVLEKWSRVE